MLEQKVMDVNFFINLEKQNFEQYSLATLNSPGKLLNDNSIK